MNKFEKFINSPGGFTTFIILAFYVPSILELF